jgi:hypothetical protein
MTVSNKAIDKTVLMSKENPSGITLESLLAQLQDEITVKNSKLIDDKTDLSLYVQENNKVILWHLHQAQLLQENSYRKLSEKGVDEGPTGKSRIGN